MQPPTVVSASCCMQHCRMILTLSAFILRLSKCVLMQDTQHVYLFADRTGTAKAEHVNTRLWPPHSKLKAATPSSSQLGANSSQSSLVYTDLVVIYAKGYIIRVYEINGVEFKLLPSSSKTKNIESTKYRTGNYI